MEILNSTAYLSFWEKNSFLSYDFIVIGAGIVGLSTAIELKENKPEASVLVLERGLFPTGASTKNAGFACFGSLTELLADLEKMPDDEVVTLVEQRWQGLQKLRSRLGDEAIGYLPNGGYELFTTAQVHQLAQLEAVNSLIQPIFPSPVFSLQSEEIKRFGFAENQVEALVRNDFEAQIDTGKMMRSLLLYAQQIGIEIRNSTEVLAIEDDGKSVQIQTAQGVTFSGQYVGICTNAFTKKLLPSLEISPGRGQVLVTAPIPKLQFKGVFHLDEGYYYFRNYRNRVIFGGGRNLDFAGETTTEIATTQLIQDDLAQKLAQIILPNTNFEIEHSWAGIMAFGQTKTPIIRHISERVHAGVRLGGMGVAIGTNVGELLARNILNSTKIHL